MAKKKVCKVGQIKLAKKCYTLGKKKEGVTIKSAKIVKGYLKIEGINDARQTFVEYWKNNKNVGMILNVKPEKFWSVWKGDHVLTEKITPYKDKIIGSSNKANADRMLWNRVLKKK